MRAADSPGRSPEVSMRLTCPTCGAEYEIADAMVPVAGRHVQCTDCHTRWFVRGAAPRTESEDEIMQRLEARSHLRAVPTPTPAAVAEPGPVPAAAPAAAAFEPTSEPTTPEPTMPEPLSAEQVEPGPVESEPVESKPGELKPVEPDLASPGPAPSPSVAPDAVAAPMAPLPRPSPRAVPAKPAERPMLAGDGLALRPAPRLDLGTGRDDLPPPRRNPRPSRFGRGLALALMLAGLALAAYLWRAELGARLPAAATTLDAYGKAVDDLRLEIDRQLDGLKG
ncbi:MAG: zinc-ribbon domain-containing protein [Amaricoccus sp.]|uniref:zinc-ribbon domain-containing protein n=1 Tax=Amaricoccus sp. TaxID=1872485 RepID=UPI0039E703B5